MNKCWQKIRSSFSSLKGIWCPTTEVCDNTTNIKLLSLSPSVSCDETEEFDAKAYFSAIDNALQDESIYNIGIVGSYGSGKSSIIRSFQKQYSNKYKFQNISLATFSDDTPKPDNSSKLLEYSVLQQILYQADPRKLPHSRFKRIHNKISYWKPISVITVFLLALLLVIKPDWLRTSTLWEWANWDNKWIALFAFVLLLASFCCIARWGVYFLKTNKLSKIGVKSGEIELEPLDDRSILNRYLDEILYYFSKSDKNILVIEDLDRFDDVFIFSKLREINILINNCESVKKKHRVVFMYAVKDDVFKDPKHRVKFFDLLIPIVPFVNTYNSADAFKKLLSGNDNIKISDDIIYDTLVFVDDMRLLKNIHNELIVFEKNVQSDGSIWDQIFAMVLYKNMIPEDFGLVHNGTSILNKVFSSESKAQLILKATEELNNRIVYKDSEIKNTESNLETEIKQLNTEYIEAFINILNVKYSSYINRRDEKIKINEAFITIADLHKIQYFNAFFEYGIDAYGFTNNGQSYMDDKAKFTIESIEKEIGALKNYQERAKEITAKYNLALLKYEIDSMRQEIDALGRKSISDIANIINIEDVISGLSADQHKLTVTLIRNGYIQEDFANYISIFFPGRITYADDAFRIKKTSGSKIEFDFHIDNPGIIIKENFNKEGDFDNPKHLNYHILKFLLDENQDKTFIFSQTSLGKYLRSILKLSAQDRLNFIIGYCKRYELDESRVFMNAIVDVDAQIWSKTCSRLNDTESKWELLLAMLRHSSKDSIEKISKDEGLANFIKNSQRILYRIDDNTITNAKFLLEQITPSFNWDGSKDASMPRSQELLDYIYEHNMYSISKQMIEFMLSEKMEAFDKLSFETRCYSYIQESGCDNLIQYIDSNIDRFIKSVYLKLEDQQDEPLEHFVALCDNQSLKPEVINAVVDKTTTIVDSINSINNIVWSKLLELHRVTPTWNNVILYFNSQGSINEILANYLNDEVTHNELIIEDFSYAEKSYKYLAVDIVTSERLSEEAHHRLDKVIANVNIARNEICNLSKQKDGFTKIEKLIHQQTIKLSPKIFSAVQDYASPLHIELLLTNPDDGIELIKRSKILVYPQDKLTLLKSDKLTQDQKTKIISTITPGSHSISSQLADDLSQFVLDAGIDKFSKEYIMVLLGKMKDQVQAQRIVIQCLIHWSDLDTKRINRLLMMVDGEYKNLAERKRKISLAANGDNFNLADQLKQIGYIKEYAFNQDNQTIEITKNTQ